MMELLAPAGGMEQLKAAVRFGADAVYGGLNRFGLRASAGNFDWEELDEALRIVHQAGKRFYLTLNILPYDDELDDLAIDDGLDLCTLVTCTPYGVNTHRLLVRGHRIPNQNAAIADGDAVQMSPVIVAAVLTALVLVAALVVRAVRRRANSGSGNGPDGARHRSALRGRAPKVLSGTRKEAQP